MNDPILQDLHATRERLLAASGGTLAGLAMRLRKEQSESERKTWEPRRTKVSSDADGQSQCEGNTIPLAR